MSDKYNTKVMNKLDKLKEIAMTAGWEYVNTTTVKNPRGGRKEVSYVFSRKTVDMEVLEHVPVDTTEIAFAQMVIEKAKNEYLMIMSRVNKTLKNLDI